jgi:phosphoglycolate phosphatase-like HAD superfamily hydrolase
MAGIGEDHRAARPFHAATVRADLYAMLGYDPTTQRFDSQSPVITAPLPTLYTLAAGVLYQHGWGWLDAELMVAQTFAPATIEPLPLALVRATAHLPTLFGALRAAGVQIAVVTSDDRAPTLAALEVLGVADLPAFIACADDGYAYKPAPDALWRACESTGAALSRTAMVGDSTTDLVMGERAGVGLRVGVLTGAMDEATLAPLADVVIPSINAIQVVA